MVRSTFFYHKKTFIKNYTIFCPIVSSSSFIQISYFDYYFKFFIFIFFLNQQNKVLFEQRGFSYQLWDLQRIKVIKIKMKPILNLVQTYLRKYPACSSIDMISDSLLKLTYTYSIPYTDSKSTKEIFLPIKQTVENKPLVSSSYKLSYNQKGRIEEVGTFQSILVSEKHEKLLQDDVFGMAKLSLDKNRWVYVASVKQQKAKSYFNKGTGKAVFAHDFGQTYEQITQSKIFVWDKSKRQVIKIQTDSTLIPACPTFSNKEGSKVLFHAYKKQQFGHGILHCFNRPVAVYQVQFQIQQQIQSSEDKQKQKELAEQKKQKLQKQKERLKNLTPLFGDNKQTNIFANISECFNYIVYCSGQGITHTYYFDLVILKRNQNNQWKEHHRIKDLLVGYYCTLKHYMTTINNRPICYSQSLVGATQTIFKVDLEAGSYQSIAKNKIGQSFAISSILQSGAILGNVTSHNSNTFFYCHGNDNVLKFVQPLNKQNFTLEEYINPIQGYYIEAKEQDIEEEYKNRIKSRPMVVLAHGGPHGALDPALTCFRYCLLKMGYALLIPNFSGSAGFGQKHLQNSLTKVGQIDAKQILALLQRVQKDKQYLDKSNVHIHGGSYGGFMGGIMGSRYPQFFKSAIIMNGVLSITANMWFSDIPEWSLVEARNNLSQLHTLKQQDYIQMHRQSPISQPMKIPTLQFLGAKDRRVPYKQGLLFDAITRKIGTPIQTYVYQNSGHALADSVQTQLDIVAKSLAFLEGVLQKQKKV